MQLLTPHSLRRLYHVENRGQGIFEIVITFWRDFCFERCHERAAQLDAMRAFDHYEEMISTEDQQGLARELARMNLPANIYTQWYWKVDLHNLLHFLRLRADAHAQYEIRVYADEICKVVADWVPFAFRAFEDYRMGGATLSSTALDCVRRMLKGEEVTQETSGMSKGEWREFQAVLG